MRSRFLIAAATILFFALLWFSNGVQKPLEATAASSCWNLKEELSSNEENLANLQRELGVLRHYNSQTNAEDEATVEKNYIFYSNRVRLDRGAFRPANDYQRYIASLDESALDYWRAKLTNVRAGGLVPVAAEEHFLSELRAQKATKQREIDRQQESVNFLGRQAAECENSASQNEPKACTESIVGTWSWWNGLRVTFTPGGGASYRGSASGSGSWQHTGGNSYHAHWNAGNTNDYFTLSRDGTKLEGQFDGKPGESTRNC